MSSFRSFVHVILFSTGAIRGLTPATLVVWHGRRSPAKTSKPRHVVVFAGHIGKPVCQRKLGPVARFWCTRPALTGHIDDMETKWSRSKSPSSQDKFVNILFVIVMVVLFSMLFVRWNNWNKLNQKGSPDVVQSQPIPTSYSPIAQNSSWQTFTSPDGLFQMLFPAVPAHTKDYIGTESAPIQGEMYRTSGSHLQYFVEPLDFSKYDTSNPNPILELPVNGIVKTLNGTILSSKLGTWNGHPKIDYLISGTSGYVGARAILIGTTLYNMGVLGTVQSDFSQSDYDRFINSFQLVGAP